MDLRLPQSLKRIDDWAFSAFAAALSFPFFYGEIKLWLPHQRLDWWFFVLVGLSNFILARIASLIARCISPSSTYGLFWGAGAIAAALFTAFGMLVVLSLQPATNSANGYVTPLWEIAWDVAGLFIVWFQVFFIFVLPLCMLGTAIFVGLLWIVLRVSAAAHEWWKTKRTAAS
jgi:hypothetical protein